jgi:hypothetical protein
MDARPLVVTALLAASIACSGGSSTEASSGGGGSSATSAGGSSSAGAAGKAATTAGGTAGATGKGGAGNGGVSGKGGGTAGGSAGGAAGQAGKAGGSGTGGGAAGVGGAMGGAAGKGGSAGGGATCSPACATPGSSCVAGACVVDCRLPAAVPCGAGTVCDVGSQHPGQCSKPGDGCVISNPPVTCQSPGGAAIVCGPGTTCGPSGKCIASLPCTASTCDGGHCWGTSCACSRPSPTCTPAALGAPGDKGTLNDFAFTRCGSLSSCDGGIVDLDFDLSCNAWGVTIISGPDYLRRIDPTGKVTEHTGVSNLDMGEVAAIRGKDGQFGGDYGDVALTYICISGCTPGPSGEQQGVAALDAASGMLPMKIPAPTVTTGMGPFGSATYDAGPFGLTWGLDRTLYVGNVKANGDFFALDLAGTMVQQIATLAKRVHAATPFDAERLVVAIEGGEVLLVPALGVAGAPKTLITLPDHVVSLVRDTWSGRIYAELHNQDIVSFRGDGTDLATFQKSPKIGRSTIAPDGYLYHVTAGYQLGPAEIVRWQLPATP